MQKKAKTKTFSKRYITINTDASWYHEQKVGAWALWIRSDRYTIKGAAAFKTMPKDAITAEAQCLVNALDILRKREPDPQGFKLIINNDCLYLHRHIRGELKMRRPEVIVLVRQIRELLEGVDYEIRHVKAHTNVLDTPKKYINDWCDKQAKAASRALIKERELHDNPC